MSGNARNNYTNRLSLFDRTPKAVYAAIARSWAELHLGLDIATDEEIEAAIVEEWDVLHQNGILSQKPPKFQKPLESACYD